MKFSKILLVCLLAAGALSCEESVQGAFDGNAQEGQLTHGGTEGGAVSPMPVPKKKWKTLLSVAGESPKKTASFEIPEGAEWQVKWDVKPNEDEDASQEEFFIILYNEQEENDQRMVANQAGPGDDFVHFEKQSKTGKFYLGIEAAQAYNVEISIYE